MLFTTVFSFFHFQIKVGDTISFPRAKSIPRTVTPSANIQSGFCKLTPLPPKEALEEQQLVESIAWPPTPPLSSPLNLIQTSDPAHSTFTILPNTGGRQWHVGDKLKVLIKIQDFQDSSKKSGGDVLFARLHNPTLGAGVAGQVNDYLNGAYSAEFSLLWEGTANVEVIQLTFCKNETLNKMLKLFYITVVTSRLSNCR